MTDLVGTTVIVPGANRGSGILKYVGPIRGKSGLFGGIELQGPSAALRGKNSGEVDGIRYFEVSQPNTGLFLPWDRLRAANPSLPTAERLKTRVLGLKRDSVYTPTPSRRSSPSPRVFGGHGAPLETGRPFLRTNSFSRDSRKLESYAALSSGSPKSEQNFAPARAVTPVNVSSELAELRVQLEQKTREFDRKEAILLELQTTVDQLHPVLEDYERSLEDKERRLKKQKSDHDRAREEWRLSLDLMLSSQQEAENLYELQIADLQEEIKSLMAKSTSDSSNGTDTGHSKEEIETLRSENGVLREKLAAAELQVLAFERENQDLRVQVEKSTNGEGSGDDNNDKEELIELLKHKVEMLTQDVTSMEIVLEDAQAKTRAKNVQIAELEIKLEELALQEVDALLSKIEGLSLDDWEKEKQQHRKAIEDLEKKLQTVTNLSQTYSENSKAELEDLRETGLEKTAKIDQLQKQIQTLIAATADSSKESQHLDTIKGLTDEKQKLNLVIAKLTQDLEKRTSYDDSELTELQNSLEMVESLHKGEMATLQAEYERSQQHNKKLESELLQLQQKSAKVSEPGTGLSENSSPLSNFQAAGGPLPIYQPDKEIDPSAGRDDWCGLCERDGHDSLNCPYENDIF